MNDLSVEQDVWDKIDRAKITDEFVKEKSRFFFSRRLALFLIEKVYNLVHHKVSHWGLRRSKRETHIIKKRRITTQTSMCYPEFEPRPCGTAVNVTNHYTGWATGCIISNTFYFDTFKSANLFPSLVLPPTTFIRLCSCLPNVALLQMYQLKCLYDSWCRAAYFKRFKFLTLVKYRV
ncbi:hypothetical protein TNCV_3249521 [Trichonephila clavipes]|nr:hypothetical protein TNCV_3249521 [Trichonephila clavipes]